MHQINHLNLGQKNYVEINDNSHGTYKINSQIEFKNSMLKSSLCDYNDADVHFKGTIRAPNTEAAAAAGNQKSNI